MDIEHGLDNVTGEIMLSTLLNQWIKYNGKPDIVRTDLEGAFRNQAFRSGLAVKSILDIDPDDASWQTAVLGKTLDSIKQSAIRVARRTPDSVTIQEILVNARQLTMTFIETEDSLRGNCGAEKHRLTSHCAKIQILLSGVSKLWMKLRSSVSE